MAASARHEPCKIPEAIHHPWELSLSGSRSDLHGAHLTLPASVDIADNDHGGAATPFAPDPGDGDKPALRRRLRARRTAFVAGLDDDARAAHLAALATRLLEQLGTARTIAAYVAAGGEIDPRPFIATAHARGLAIALPRVAGREAPMSFHRWRPGDPLVTGALGIPEPPPESSVATPDLILTPLVGFDRAGGRLGQGAGHYDRAFAGLPEARRIGLGWRVQEAVRLPLDPWDVPLHAVATEQEWITP